MNCPECGGQVSSAAPACPHCGHPLASGLEFAPAQQRRFTPGASGTGGGGFSTAGIVLGAIAFLVYPVIFGPMGLILGAVGRSKGEQKAVVAMTVSALGLIVGMLIGALVASKVL